MALRGVRTRKHFIVLNRVVIITQIDLAAMKSIAVKICYYEDLSSICDRVRFFCFVLFVCLFFLTNDLYISKLEDISI